MNLVISLVIGAILMELYILFYAKGDATKIKYAILVGIVLLILISI